MTLDTPLGLADVVDLRESSPRKHLHQHPSTLTLLRKRGHPVEVIEVLDSPATKKDGELLMRPSCNLRGIHSHGIHWV